MPAGPTKVHAASAAETKTNADGHFRKENDMDYSTSKVLDLKHIPNSAGNAQYFDGWIPIPEHLYKFLQADLGARGGPSAVSSARNPVPQKQRKETDAPSIRQRMLFFHPIRAQSFGAWTILGASEKFGALSHIGRETAAVPCGNVQTKRLALFRGGAQKIKSPRA
jgi:hypothetical protein